MTRMVSWALVLGLCGLALARARAADTLDIHFVDVEGGQATLIVTPAGETLLVDAGFPGAGTFGARPGRLDEARDARRIAAAAREAGVTRIDYLLVTHFHADHDGGVPELAQLLPIGTFIDHVTFPRLAERNVKGSLDAYNAYADVRARGRHIEPMPGDRLPLAGIEAIVVSSAGSVLNHPLEGAGRPNPECGSSALPAQEPNENPRSTGFVLRFGDFRFLDVGDLTGRPLFDLACPSDLIGPVDVYLVTHHGGGDAADPATLAAFRPRVAVLNNGPRKGGAPETLAVLRRARAGGLRTEDAYRLGDVWQLHRSEIAGAVNFTDDRIANVDATTAHGIKIAAREDGSFDVTNGRTGAVARYPAR